MSQDVVEKPVAVETPPTLTAQRIALWVIGAMLILGLALWGVMQLRVSDPYIQAVLTQSGDRARGEDIFRLNCATCHGLEAGGEVGPNLHGVSDRKSRVGLIKQVTSGQTPPMPQFQPNATDMADLLAFLESL